MKSIKEIFLPPGIQMRLHENPPCGQCLHDFAVAQIDALWARRNSASDADVDRIDALMESIVRSESDSAPYCNNVPHVTWTPAQIEQIIQAKLARIS